MREAIDNAEPITTELRNYRQDGTMWWNKVSIAPIYDHDGAVEHYVGFQEDVTDRKEREAELERTREFFTEAERLGDLGAWEFDASGEVIWTDGTRRIHEVDDDYEPSLEEGIEFFHPDDRDKIRTAVESALEAGKSYDIEARILTAAGNERWIRTRGGPVPDSGSTIRGFVQDITDRKERERELQQQREYMTDILDAIEDVFFVHDEAGNIQQWNRSLSERTGYTDAELETMHGTDFVPDSQVARAAAAIEEAFETGQGQLKAPILTKDGETIPYEFIANRVTHPDGDPRLVGIGRDITERKERERELQRRNERLEELNSVVSHDLRNPLRVAEGQVELAQEECDSEHLDTVADAHERMNQLIDDLLTLAQTDTQPTETEPVDLAALVETCWRTVPTADAELRVEADWTIHADSKRVRQLFENLFRNAIDHGGPEVMVTIGALEEGFYVADDGPGIPTDEREKVLEAGYSTGSGGTGFGLSIVKRIVEAHGWTLHVTDSDVGGARFEITGVEFAA